MTKRCCHGSIHPKSDKVVKSTPIGVLVPKGNRCVIEVTRDSKSIIMTFEEVMPHVIVEVGHVKSNMNMNFDDYTVRFSIS